MPLEVQVRKATIAPFSRGGTVNESERINVHFNPVSLQFQLSTTLKEEGEGNQATQYVTKSTAKLSMDLVFDTTQNGQNVRAITSKIASFMQPSPDGTRQVPSRVEFVWGDYRFVGMIESFKETIDFFSASGVPLRSTVNLTLAAQDRVFQRVPETAAPAGDGPRLAAQAVDVPNPGDTTRAAGRGGDSRAARDIAAANDLESMRFSGAATLTLSAGVELRAAAAFSAGVSLGFGAGAAASFGAGAAASFGAGASASFGAGAAASFGAGASASFGAGAAASFGAGASASFGAGASASFGAGASASFGAGASARLGSGGAASFGSVSSTSGRIVPPGSSLASAGVPAAFGAFSGLRTRPAPSVGRAFDPRLLLPRASEQTLSTGLGASFSLGGRALAAAGARADVGQNQSLRSRLQFDGEGR